MDSKQPRSNETASNDPTAENRIGKLSITILGTGTSSGVPTVGCTCEICQSQDPRDKRLRTSVWIRDERTSIVIDTSSDFRAQCLMNGIGRIDGVVYTHHHFDHIAGFDDLRAFNFVSQRPVDIYGMPETLTAIRSTFAYAFNRNNFENSAPSVVTHEVLDDQFEVGGLTLLPLPLKHGTMRVNGYRIGDFAYCTDCNQISDLAELRLRGVRTLVLDALRKTPHPTHFTLEQAVEAAHRIGAENTYFTHIAHDLGHAEIEAELPPGIHLAHDQLTFEAEVV